MLRDAILPALLLALGAGCVLLVGCAGTEAERPVEPAYDLHHPDGVRRARAVQDVAARGDRRWVPDLIELLDDADETVRLQAGAALRQLTGHDTGYAPFLSRAERREHIARWRAWWAEQTQARGGPDTAGSGAPATAPVGSNGDEIR